MVLFANSLLDFLSLSLLFFVLRVALNTILNSGQAQDWHFYAYKSNSHPCMHAIL